MPVSLVNVTKKNYKKGLFLFLVLLVPISGSESYTYINADPISIINKEDSMPAMMKKIAQCESGSRQFNDEGNVLRGEINPMDVGLFQISK